MEYLKLVAAALILLVQLSAAAKTASPKGKECKKQIDCRDVGNTTCLSDPRDSKMRCLCASKRLPVDGICNKTELRGPCLRDEDCVGNAECASPGNATAQMCACRLGFEEENATFCANRGRECVSVANCSDIANTTCMVDSRDVNKTRCLCGDRTPPVNGSCENAYRVVGFPCNIDAECVENAICMVSSAAARSATNDLDMASETRMCVCGAGFMENENKTMCESGAAVALQSIGLILASVLICKFNSHLNM